MTSKVFDRRKLMGSLGAMVSAIGVGSLMTGTALAKKSKDSDVRKLNRDGKPADGKQMITPLITHNIETHTTKVMENVKELVQTGGGSMDSILQLTVYLADLAYYDPMNQIFKTYFPNGGPARTTVAVAALPGKSMIEINCIAAIVRK